MKVSIAKYHKKDFHLFFMELTQGVMIKTRGTFIKTIRSVSIQQMGSLLKEWTTKPWMWYMREIYASKGQNTISIKFQNLGKTLNVQLEKSFAAQLKLNSTIAYLRILPVQWIHFSLEINFSLNRPIKRNCSLLTVIGIGECS